MSFTSGEKFWLVVALLVMCIVAVQGLTVMGTIGALAYIVVLVGGTLISFGLAAFKDDMPRVHGTSARPGRYAPNKALVDRRGAQARTPIRTR